MSLSEGPHLSKVGALCFGFTLYANAVTFEIVEPLRCLGLRELRCALAAGDKDRLVGNNIVPQDALLGIET